MQVHLRRINAKQVRTVVGLIFDHLFGCGFNCVPRRIWQRLGTSPHRASFSLLLCRGRDAPVPLSLSRNPPPLAWAPHSPTQRCCHDADMALKQAPGGDHHVQTTARERLGAGRPT